MITIYVTQPITNARILPTTALPDDAISTKILVGGSPGEYVPATFTIHTDSEIHGLLPTRSNLSGDGFIPAGNVDIRYVKCWLQAPDSITTRQHPAGVYIFNKRKELMPELLLKDDTLVEVVNDENQVKMLDGSYRWVSEFADGPEDVQPTNDEFPVMDAAALQPVTILANTNKQVWATIKIPKTAQPGSYNGTIDLIASEGSIGQIELNLQVYNINLGEPPFETTMCFPSRFEWRYPIGQIGIWRNDEQMAAEMNNLKEHGITNPCCEQPLVWRNGQLNWTDKLRNYLSIRQSAGLQMNPLYYRVSFIKNVAQDYDILRQILREIKDICSQYGVDDLYTSCPDEETLTDEGRRQIAIAHDEGFKVFLSGKWQQLSPTADIVDMAFTCGGNWGVDHNPKASFAKLFHDYGHKLMSYSNPQGGVEKPETYRRNYGLLLWQADYDGGMMYCYQHEAGFSWNDFDHKTYKDHNMIYPSINGVIDTLQWEGYREGITDARYLATLLGAIEIAKTQGIDTSAAESYLANLKTANLSTKNLDQVRTDIINHILYLQGEPVPPPPPIPPTMVAILWSVLPFFPWEGPPLPRFTEWSWGNPPKV